MPTTDEWVLYQIADGAITLAQDALLLVEPQYESIDFPPSALIACLMKHAAQDGWDFDAACRVARTFGAASCHDIVPDPNEKHVTAHAVGNNDTHQAATIQVRDYSTSAAEGNARRAAKAMDMSILTIDYWPKEG